MSGNDIPVTGGSGYQLATDNVSPGTSPGRHFQFVKLAASLAGSVAGIDKLIGQLVGGAGNDVGLPLLGWVRDQVIGSVPGIGDGVYGVPVMDVNNRLAIYADGMRKRLKDDFSGAAVDATKWSVTTFGGGTATVAGSNLTLSTGDALSGSGVELLSVDTFQAPMRLIALLNSISQRIVNQEFSIELVDEATVAGGVGLDAAKILFNGVTNTSQQVTTLCHGDQDGPNVWGTGATSAATKYEINVMPDECWFYGISSLNSTSSRSWYAHQDRKTPDAGKRFRIRLRLRNTAAAASATTVALDAIIVEDNAYVPVELAHARGSTISGEAQAVNVANGSLTGIVAGVGDKAQWFDETAVALGAAATFTGATRDLGLVTTGSTITGFPGTFRMLAIQDVVGTLYGEVSADGVTWYRVAGKTLTQFDATARFSAFLDVPMIAREARAVLVNGAGAAAVTRVFTKMGGTPGT